MVEITDVSRCTAKSKQSGVQCKRYPVPGRKVCKIHGGATPRGGVTHHAFKDGKYSKFMPKKLLDNYEIAINDPELLSLRNEIAITDSRIMELLGKVDQGEAGALWKKLKAKVKEYDTNTDDAESKVILSELFTLVKCGYKDHMVWNELYTVLDNRKKIVESERKAYVEMGHIITMEQASIMMLKVSKTINDNVTDPKTKQLIAASLSGIIGGLSKPLLED